MESSVIALFIMSALQGIAMYFMKQSHDHVKSTQESLDRKLEKLSDEAHRKTDFQEFKNELWRKLDDMKADFQRALDKQ